MSLSRSLPLLPLLGLLVSPSALAQPPRPNPADREPEIYDPAPASPIDRPRSSKSEKEIAAEMAAVEPPPPPRQVGVVWVGWTVGTGYGWHPEQELETESRLKAGAAFGAGRLGHFGPEVGYQWRERIAFTLQTRHQIIPKVVTDQYQEGEPNQWAHSILAKAMYLFPRGRLQPYLGGMLGGGSGFRFRIDPQPSNNLPTSDTVRGGPLVLGPVGGLVFPIIERLHLVAELRALVGAPDFGAMAEANLGLQFDL
jgi:hypothetical protein